MARMEKHRFLLKPGFFVVSLLLSTYLVLWIEKLKPSDLGSYKNLFMKEAVIKKSDSYPLRKPLTAMDHEDLTYAKIAWKYFENNYNKKTGFVNGREGSDAFTMKDLGDYLMGMLAAYELNIIDTVQLDTRMKAVIRSLAHLPLYNDKLPNVSYSTSTAEMLDSKEVSSETGEGWNALDLGRFFSFVHKVMVQYPAYLPSLKRALSDWNLDDMVINGNLYGMRFDVKEKKPVKFQQGRLGYEEYASKGLLLMGYDVSEAIVYTDFCRFVNIYDKDIAIDTRELRDQFDENFITSEPYLLDGIEYGWDINSKELAYRIFLAQKARYMTTNIVTSVSEEYVDAGMKKVYNTVYADNKPWNCITANGEDMTDYRFFSTKAAFAWSALFDDPYADVLRDEAKKLYEIKKGWYAGIYEKNGKVNKVLTASTNGVILEAVNYKINGLKKHI